MVRNRGLIWDPSRAGWNQKLIGGRGGGPLNVTLFKNTKKCKNHLINWFEKFNQHVCGLKQIIHLG